MECGNFAQRHGQQLRRERGCQLTVTLDGFGSQFLLRMLAKELLEQHRECGGGAAATVVAPAFASSYFCSFCARRFASASPASRLLAKPDFATNRRSCTVEPGALNRYRQTVVPDPYLRLNTGISSTPLPLVGVEVQRPPAGCRCAPRPGTRAWL